MCAGAGIGIRHEVVDTPGGGPRTNVDESFTLDLAPGIYVEGKWGMRLEDIVVATDAGPRPLNASDHDLVAV